MYLNKPAVTPEFRQQISTLLPGLGENKAYWKMTGHLMFTGGLEAGQILIPAELIARIEGNNIHGKYCAWDFIQAYQRDVVRLDVSVYTTSQCRSVTHVYWPEYVEMLLKGERRKDDDELVLFWSGAKWRREHAVKSRAEVQEEALEIMRNMGNHPACDLLALLNRAASNKFAAIKKHLEAARLLVPSLGLVEDEVERQYNILKAIKKQAQPFYTPAERSVRIFAFNDCVARLQRDVRHVVTQDWIHCDLKSAQLAIVAKTWNVPGVAEFLRSGGSIWATLCDWMSWSMDAKPVLKDALYAFIFGSGRDKMIELLGSRKAYMRFGAHPLMRQLFLARALQLRQIRKDKGATDAFGKKLHIEYVTVPNKKYTYDTSRKIMALAAQSYELLLLTPVIQAAVDCQDSTRGFCLLLWLHDGFSFVTCHKDDRVSWARRLQKAVNQQAISLGVATELEVPLLDSQASLPDLCPDSESPES